MTDERRTAGRPARSTSRRPSGAPSAGLPRLDAGSAADRLAELETRLERLETSSGLRERGRDLMGRVAPPEASQHFRNAGREQLLGIRSIVDFWIRRIESAEAHADAPAAGRESIQID